MKSLQQTTSNHLKHIWPELTPSHHSLLVTMALITGLSLGFSISDDLLRQMPLTGMAGLTSLILLSAIFLMFKGYALIGSILKFITLVLIGLLLVLINLDAPNTDNTTSIPSERIEITGHVAMVEVMRGDRQRVRLRRHVNDDWASDDWPIDLNMDIRLITGRNNEKLKPGDVVRGLVRMNPPLPMVLPNSFDFQPMPIDKDMGRQDFSIK